MTAEQCLEELGSSGHRVGFGDEAQRLLGRARADLEYRRFTDILGNLPVEMEKLQETCSDAAGGDRPALLRHLRARHVGGWILMGGVRR